MRTQSKNKQTARQQLSQLMANQNRAKYYQELMRTQSKNKQTARGAKKRE